MMELFLAKELDLDVRQEDVEQLSSDSSEAGRKRPRMSKQMQSLKKVFSSSGGHRNTLGKQRAAIRFDVEEDRSRGQPIPEEDIEED